MMAVRLDHLCRPVHTLLLRDESGMVLKIRGIVQCICGICFHIFFSLRLKFLSSQTGTGGFRIWAEAFKHTQTDIIRWTMVLSPFGGDGPISVTL